jgi:hypothetical protein
MKMLILFFLFSFATLYAQETPVYVVLFTHIEDNTPTGTLGSQQSRDHYISVRSKMIEMANLALRYNVKWSFQPDWKILLAALIYEDTALMNNTNGKNFLRYMKENLGVIIDPHSHEQLGYNYTDVAHLLDSLGVGGSTVIGGHVWDPNLLQFQRWDRFRIPVRGTKYPWAIWRGDILMGSGTPNHVNDPIVSGVWRPKDKYNYFVDDPNGNIFCIGQFKGDIESTSELINIYKLGKVLPQYILTSSYHIKPLDITNTNGIKAIEDMVVKPLVALRDKGEIIITDFASLINEWKNKFNSTAYIYDLSTPTGINERDKIIPHSIMLYQNYPNPFNPTTTIRFALTQRAYVTLKVFDVLGREVAMLVEGGLNAGEHSVVYDAKGLASGIYFYRLTAGTFVQQKKMEIVK